ncbi:metallophosphoesterase family protein [Sphingomonas sp. KR3-1]|uniref:metallophosphoesterase family protein n=1 Tax=Sphingomonas sp. KR3-1 TaxID=3156611 RepID=UPI0032B41380
MFAKLFRARPSAPAEPEGNIPDGQRVYAVGDIHGRLDLLKILLAQIEADDARRPAAATTLIFLGDLIDRGPASAQVIEHLRRFATERPAGSTRFLTGNHEEVFLQSLEGDEKTLRFFAKIGGRETILSYGFSEDEYAALDYAELLFELQAKVPAEHRAFLQGFEDMIILGDYAFVHAGIRPGEPLSRQHLKDLRWIRNEFLEHKGAHEKIVVHGHTIAEDVEVTRHRIGLDTGAYATGKLTAMGFEGNQRWVIDTAS